MSNYVFVYRAPKGYAPATGEAVAAWQAWFEDLGASVLDAGNPVFERRAVGSCSEETVLGGYSLIAADNLDEAVELAQGCPYLSRGGGVEVGELTLLNPESLATTVDDHARVSPS